MIQCFNVERSEITPLRGFNVRMGQIKIYFFQGVEIETGSIFPLKNFFPFIAKSTIKPAISFAVNGA